MIHPVLLGRTPDHHRAIRFAQGDNPAAEDARELALTVLVVVLAAALAFVALSA